MKTQALGWIQKIWGDFKSFQPGQKVVTIAAVVGLVVGGILFASWKSQPNYSPLYSNLSSTDAAAVVQQLSDDKIPYQLAAGGAQILVPQSVVYDTRLKMSAAGLPGSSSGGYALLDKEGITTSDFKQQVDFQRAVEGELAKTIEAMDGVAQASVHLAIPKQDVFNDGSKQPTAAVMLTMKPGAAINASQVQSVVYLVSSSVPQLTPENVTVADSAGKVLAAPGDNIAGVAGSDARSQMTQDYNDRVASSLQTMLNTALGPGHAVVTVNSELDFDHTSTTTQDYTYKPNTPPVWTDQQTEKYTGSQGAGGTMGTGQPAEVAGTAGGSGSGNYDKSSQTVTNALGTVTQTVQNTPGAVKKLAVAVLLDKAAPNLNTAAIQSLVTSAVGLNTSRGDTLAIEAMAFDTSGEKAAAAQQAAADKASAAQASAAQLNSWIKQGTIAGLILLVFVGTIIASKRRKKNRPEAPVDDVALITHALPDGALLPPPTPRRPEPEPMVVGDGGAGRRALVALAREQPDDVARVLSGWLGSAEPAREGAKR
jgi:flagellar M-ring protein FliF